MRSRGAFTKDAETKIIGRDQGRCADCGRHVVGFLRRGIDWAIHHRRPRDMGGTSLQWVRLAANGVVLCDPCHRKRESNRVQAVKDGFLISALGIATAETTCIQHHLYGWVLLDNEGGYKAAEHYGEEWARERQGV